MSTEEKKQVLLQPLINQENPEEKSAYQQRINSIGRTLENISNMLMKITGLASVPLAIIPSTKTTLDSYHMAYVDSKVHGQSDAVTTEIYNNTGTPDNAGLIAICETWQGLCALSTYGLAYAGGLFLTKGTVKDVMSGLVCIGVGVALSSVNTMISYPNNLGSSAGSYAGYLDGWCEEIANTPECSNRPHDRTSHDLGIPQTFWVGTITAIAGTASGVLSGIGKKMKNYQDPPRNVLPVNA